HLAVLRPPALERAYGVDAGARGVLAGHQAGPRGGAILAVVVAGEAQALRGEAVDVRRLVVLRALAAQVRPAEVVGQDEDDIGPPGSLRPGRVQVGGEGQGDGEAAEQAGRRQRWRKWHGVSSEVGVTIARQL